MTMEMTADTLPQEQEKVQPEQVVDDGGWLTDEERLALVEELEAFKAGGGTFEDFIQSKGLSKSSMQRYIKQFRGRKATKRIDKVARFEEAEQLIASGMVKTKALKKAGITYATWHYYKYDKNKRHSEPKKYSPRVLKPAPAVSDDGYNKSLRARIITLERLVVELSLDKQALMEAREGAI